MQYITKQDDMIDRICFKHYKKQSGAVEAVYEANPDLAVLGPLLPAGVTIALPDLPAEKDNAFVNIWD